MRFKAILFILPVLLVACGSINANVGTTSGPTVLHVTRTSSDPYGKHIGSFDRTVTDVAAVQRLYTAALALPKVTGVYNCPIGPALEYHLSFLKGASSMQQINLQASGCQFLSVSKTDSRVTNTAFLSLFMKTVGISSLFSS
jgi:hypothetical protein